MRGDGDEGSEVLERLLGCVKPSGDVMQVGNAVGAVMNLTAESEVALATEVARQHYAALAAVPVRGTAGGTKGSTGACIGVR